MILFGAMKNDLGGNMRTYVKTISMLIIVAIMAVLVGCGAATEDGTGIISSENIKEFSVELFDQSMKTFEGDAIEQVAEMLNQATLTREKSVQDTPDGSPLGKITINDGEEILYYYQEGDKNYIEKPYVGIYETTVDIDVFFSGL